MESLLGCAWQESDIGKGQGSENLIFGQNKEVGSDILIILRNSDHQSDPETLCLLSCFVAHCTTRP